MFPDKVSSVEPPVHIALLLETILPAVVAATPILVEEVVKPVHEEALTMAL